MSTINANKRVITLAVCAAMNSGHVFRITATDRRYMLLEPKIEPLKQDPFWTQRGKRTKGKRGRY